MSEPILYSFRRCPYAIRARMAIVESGLGVLLREVSLRDKPEALLACSAKGTVPVLVLEAGRVIDESLEIMLWAYRQHDPCARLRPLRGSIDRMRDLIARCDAEFKPALDRYKYPQRYATADPNSARDGACRFLDLLERRLAAEGGLHGPHPALADIAIMPFVRQFAGVEPEWFEAQAWPRLRAWMRGLLHSDAFLVAMRKQTPWTGASAGVPFPAH